MAKNEDLASLLATGTCVCAASHVSFLCRRPPFVPSHSLPPHTMSSKTSFGWRDYWRMLTCGRPWLPFRYFTDVHAFDLCRGTDTHTRLVKDEYGAAPPGFEDGVLYMASWTSEIDRIFGRVRDLLGDDFESYSFVDVGCGKGKVVLRWTELCARVKCKQHIAGFDYHEPLISIARSNYALLFGKSGHLTTETAERYDFGRDGQRVICYLFNPFGPTLMRRFLARLRHLDVLLVYNNPVEDDTVRDMGFVAVSASDRGCPNARTIIYTNRRV